MKRRGGILVQGVATVCVTRVRGTSLHLPQVENVEIEITKALKMD
jgi:hypothetical protein